MIGAISLEIYENFSKSSCPKIFFRKFAPKLSFSSFYDIIERSVLLEPY